MVCENCGSERGLIARQYEGGKESYCSFECYQLGVSKIKYIKTKKLLSIDDIAEQGGKCLIFAAILKLDIEAHFEKAKVELDQMIETEIQGRNEKYIKRISRVALLYRHVAMPEINHPTALKLAMKYAACRTLEGMLSAGVINGNLVESYLRDHLDIVDFSKYTCSSCNDIKPSSGCELHHGNL